KRCGFMPRLRRVATRHEMRCALEQESWDIVFADCKLPIFSGTEALALIRNLGFNIPAICLSGSEDSSKTDEVLNAGARALIKKDNLDPLCAAIRQVLNREPTKPKEN